MLGRLRSQLLCSQCVSSNPKSLPLIVIIVACLLVVTDSRTAARVASRHLVVPLDGFSHSENILGIHLCIDGVILCYQLLHRERT